MARAYPPPLQDLRTLADHMSSAGARSRIGSGWACFPLPGKNGGSVYGSGKRSSARAAQQASDAASPNGEAESITNATRAAAGRHD